MWYAIAACLVVLGLSSATPAPAKVKVEIDLSTQSMHVRSRDGSYAWPVSTARAGYSTPRGHFRPAFLKRMHYSRKYDMSPMPHSIFFAGGYAIHGTYETRALGRPASHGCIRLAPRHAARLFELVKAEGATITIVGRRPAFLRRGKATAVMSEQRSSGRRGADAASAETSRRSRSPAQFWTVTPRWEAVPEDAWR